MRILLMNTSFPPMARSAAHIFHELGCNLITRGHQVNVVTELPWRRLGSDKVLSRYRKAHFHLRGIMDGMDVVRVRGFPFKEASLMGRGINALLLPVTFYFGTKPIVQNDIALVYCPPLTLGLAAFLIQQLHHVPFIFNVQDIYPQTLIDLDLIKNPLLIRFFEWMERFIYKKAACIVVHSEGNRQYLINQKAVPSGKVIVIPNWVNVNIIRPSEKLNGFREKHSLGTKFLVCYAGTMGYAQDLNPIIQAAKELHNHDDILFLLIGEGPRADEWKQKVNQLHLNNVQFLPLQPKTVYTSIVAASDVGLVPLTDDLSTPVVPGKLLDFMAGGRPVIATVNMEGDTVKIIKEAQCGFTLAPSDSQGVTKAILELYNNKSLSQRLGVNGRAYAESHFSLEVCTAQYEALFHQIVEKQKEKKLRRNKNHS